jgi:DNA repair exonuclease SbcCD ATPase subunit
MTEVAIASINTFGILPKANFVSPSEGPVFILTSGQLQEIISQAIAQALGERQEALVDQDKLLQLIETQAEEIATLKSILQAQDRRLKELESLQEVYHGESPAPEDRPSLREALQRQKEAQGSLPSRVWSIEEDLKSLEQEVSSLKEREPQAPGGGKKTQARIRELKQVLKASGGSRTFKELEKSLGLSPQQFTYLVSHLDKRSFEISRRPGTKRGEKVLSLRVRVKEPLVFT